MTVVVGYIPTPEGMAAVDHAIEMAREHDSRLVVVNTGHHGNDAHPNFATAADIDALDARLREPRHGPRDAPAGGWAVAADEILATATELDGRADRHRHPAPLPVGKLLTGSTAQQILLDAECAVLAVKAPVAGG